MRGFLKSGAASMAMLAVQALIASTAARGHQIGPGKKTHKRLANGEVSMSFAGGVKSRQVERAEGRAELKAMERRAKKRGRDNNAKDLARRVGEREMREVDRRDTRLGVHEIIERGAFGRLSRKRFA